MAKYPYAGFAAKPLKMPTQNPEPRTQNRLFHIITFGCKVNQCDTAGMARELTLRGWRAAAPGARSRTWWW